MLYSLKVISSKKVKMLHFSVSCSSYKEFCTDYHTRKVYKQKHTFVRSNEK